ncbi:MAG: alpha/beta hydrolase [Clostridia bacterium]|nr:alpha/beta hydrolase [Clostridia bacterium]
MKKEINGLNINYLCEGSGPPVLLLHGWGANITLFRGIVDLLKSSYTVLAPDLPGFGESDEPPAPWCVDDYVDFVLDFLKDFPTEKLIVLGHSFGGRVIIKLASRETPFTLEKVILVDAAGVKPKKTLRQKIRQRLFKIGKRLLSLRLVKKLFPNALENLRKRSGSADYNAASPLMRQTLVRVVNEDLCDLMPNVTCPALLIWGVNDDATPLADGQTMERLMPEAALVKIENAGHYSFLEQPALVQRILASFLNVK